MLVYGIKNNDELKELLSEEQRLKKEHKVKNKKLEDSKKYNKDYFEDGEKLGVSCYKDYRWIPELTIPMTKNIVNVLKIDKNDRILDFGCAKGFFVKALHELDFKNSYGLDISEYAIENCDKSIQNFVDLLKENQTILEKFGNYFDWVVCKDVLEHVPYQELEKVLLDFFNVSKNCFIVVPLGKNGQYVVPEYEKDITHIIREDLEWWKNKIESSGYTVTYSEYSFPGVKENWSMYSQGNGFFIATRK